MSCQRMCRTFTRVSLIAYRPSLKVVPLGSAINNKCPLQFLSIKSQIIFVFYVPNPGSTDHVESVMDEVEKYMMSRLYKEVFCPETTDDEKKDLAIQKRIRSVRKAVFVLRLLLFTVFVISQHPIMHFVAGLYTGSPSRCCVFL